jgi:hypothetical protein
LTVAAEQQLTMWGILNAPPVDELLDEEARAWERSATPGAVEFLLRRSHAMARDSRWWKSTQRRRDLRRLLHQTLHLLHALEDDLERGG